MKKREEYLEKLMLTAPVTRILTARSAVILINTGLRRFGRPPVPHARGCTPARESRSIA
jgi:hypothetical protein